jgi:membrane protein implicated in regulation of membrane protease activity
MRLLCAVAFVAACVFLLFCAAGCTTETGGQAQKLHEESESIWGYQRRDGRTTTIQIDADGRATLIESRSTSTTRPSSLTIRRDSASTTQPSFTTTGDAKGKIEGTIAGELGDFKFEGIQKSPGNLALAGLAMLIAVACYFLLPPPKKWFAIAFCVAVSVLSLLMPWLVAAIALGAVVIVILWWAAAHKLQLDQMVGQLTGSVKNIIDDHQAQSESIKDSAARAQVDPKIKAAIRTGTP